jgi:lysophospholipase L1-like esterase
MASPRRRAAGPLLLLSASAAVTLLLLELAFRAARPSVGTVQINRATVRRSANPRLLFELRPGAAVRAEVAYRVNALGLRGPEVAQAKAPGTRRVAVLGDSIAFGYWVAEEDAFPRRLEALLGGPGPVQVLNFGVPGYNLDQEIEVLRSRVLAFAPDAVVVALCLNDLEGVFSYEYGLTVDRADRRRTTWGRLREAILPRSVLLSWIEYRLTERRARRAWARARNPLEGPLYAEAVAEQERALRSRFDALRELLRPAGIPGVVAVFPTFGKAFAAYPHLDLHRAVTEAGAGAGLGVVDLLDCFRVYEFRRVRVDVVHPNPLGHRVAAHAIRDALCARGLVCEAAPATAGRCTDYRPEDFPSVRGW